ncbi:MAG: helix-turn-helix transcriptional regulator [Clostridia bacterium]|nr:helix-turn-helix transcriptional regulator [Clostridia bacterium]
MKLIKCEMCDVKTTHPKKFIFRDEKGRAAWLLMCFYSDFIYFADGEMHKGKKFQCIINSPGTPLIHGPEGSEKGFENDWIHFSGDGINELINELELPVNRSFYVDNSNCTTPFIKQIMEEEKMPICFSEHRISSIIYDMLVYIARQRAINKFTEHYSYNSISNVREYMLENYMNNFTVKKLAEEAGYSPSRFCELYKLYFNSSPINDLINMRIKKAKQFLLCTDKSVGEISVLCGFETVHYFSYIFKKYVGSSPNKYRKFTDNR